jgi:hypothetical protein
MNPQEQPAPDTSQTQQPAQPEPPAVDKPAHSSRLSNIGLLLAILVPPLGAIVSIIAWWQISKKSLKGRKIAVFGTIWGLAFSLPFLYFSWFIVDISGGFHGNGAQSAAKPFLAKVEQAGGKKICENGDSGYGIDNNRPWYDAYYQIPDSSSLTNKIKNFANQTGYSLGTDKQAISQLQQNSLYALPGDEQFNPSTDYLTGNNGDKTLTVTINRRTSVTLNCSSGQYGRKQATGDTDAILDISFQLPDVKR